MITKQSRELEMLRMVLAGMRNCDIAERFGMCESSVSVIVNSPLFKQKVREKQKELDNQAFSVKAYMQEHAEPAAKEIVGIMKDKINPANTRLSAAVKVLNFAGEGSDGQSGNTQNNYFNMTFEQKMEAARQGIDINEDGQVIECQSEEIPSQENALLEKPESSQTFPKELEKVAFNE
jgi:hypothetical protein